MEKRLIKMSMERAYHRVSDRDDAVELPDPYCGSTPIVDAATTAISTHVTSHIRSATHPASIVFLFSDFVLIHISPLSSPTTC